MEIVLLLKLPKYGMTSGDIGPITLRKRWITIYWFIRIIPNDLNKLQRNQLKHISGHIY